MDDKPGVGVTDEVGVDDEVELGVADADLEAAAGLGEGDCVSSCCDLCVEVA